VIRRLFAFVLAVAALALLPATASASFTLGVAAGEIKSTSARLWAHSTRSGTATVEVATDRRFRDVVERKNARARSSHDNNVQTVVRGLEPGEHYWYRWEMGNSRSRKGQFDTAPSPRSSEAITFAFSGDADATPAPGTSTPFYNKFEVYKRMAREGNDFNINLGDTIYSDTEIAGVQAIARTKEQKWEKYKQNLALRNLQALRSGGGLYNHWDDHEFINDFSLAENGQAIFNAGVKAFRDYSPVSYASRRGIYRTFRWGKNVELFFLDERSFRDAKASRGGTCDNPQTGEPDLAPTAPQRTRNTFALLVPSFSAPVSQACKDRINDPARDYLGAAQLERFFDDVKDSKARFKVIVNELPILQLYALPYDRWEGYAFERFRVLQFLRDNVENVIFLSTDIHGSFVGDARFRTLEDPGPLNSGILDVSTGPVATRTFGKQIDATTGRQGAGQAVDDAFFEQPPPNGAGLDCTIVDKYSYGQVTVRRTRLTVQLRGDDGKALTDEDGKPCSRVTLEP
jgi:alkaline phosphatase D